MSSEEGEDKVRSGRIENLCRASCTDRQGTPHIRTRLHPFPNAEVPSGILHLNSRTMVYWRATAAPLLLHCLHISLATCFTNGGYARFHLCMRSAKHRLG